MPLRDLHISRSDDRADGAKADGANILPGSSEYRERVYDLHDIAEPVQNELDEHNPDVHANIAQAEHDPVVPEPYPEPVSVLDNMVMQSRTAISHTGPSRNLDQNEDGHVDEDDEYYGPGAALLNKYN